MESGVNQCIAYLKHAFANYRSNRHHVTAKHPQTKWPYWESIHDEWFLDLYLYNLAWHRHTRLNISISQNFLTTTGDSGLRSTNVTRQYNITSFRGLATTCSVIIFRHQCFPFTFTFHQCWNGGCISIRTTSRYLQLQHSLHDLHDTAFASTSVW